MIRVHVSCLAWLVFDAMMDGGVQEAKSFQKQGVFGAARPPNV